MTKPVIGFIGTGVMGLSTAGHLMRAGYPLKVYNRTREKAEPLLEAGACWGEQPRRGCSGVRGRRAPVKPPCP